MYTAVKTCLALLLAGASLVQAQTGGAAAAAAASATASAQNLNTPIGVWQTLSDKTGKPEAHVTIREHNGKLVGTVSKRLRPDEGDGDFCTACKDDRKGKPYIGLEIIRGVSSKAEEGVWRNGKVLDPEEGKEYKLTLTPIAGGKQLQVRGFIGPFFRTQKWTRVQ